VTDVHAEFKAGPNPPAVADYSPQQAKLTQKSPYVLVHVFTIRE
jgi:hypothetical protein